MSFFFFAKRIIRQESVFAIILLVLINVSVIKCAQATAIPEQLSFQNIIENKDILFGEGASFLQDSEGFMWLGGSHALIRYDGYEFKQVNITVKEDTNNPALNNSAPNNPVPNNMAPIYYVETLFEDSHHQLWAGTRSGLLLYDSRKETLVSVQDDGSQPQTLSSSTVMEMIELPSGELVAGSMAGIFVIDPITHKYTTITPDPTKPHWLKSARIESVLLDSNNTIWFGTEAGLEKLDWATKTFTFYRIDRGNYDSAADAHIMDMVSDHNGNLWLATRHGLVYFDPKTLQQKRYLNDHNNRFSLGGNDIWSLLLDSQGILWVGTDGGGVSVYDKDKDRFINHKNEIGRSGSLNTNVVRSLFEDKNGDIWIGNYPSGINFFDRSSSAIASYANDLSNPKSLSNTSVLGVAEDSNGNLWLGTDGGGLNFFDRKNNEFSHFKTDPNDAGTISGDAVLSTYIDSFGIVWAGTWSGGVSSYDPTTNNPNTKKFTRYPFDIQRNATTSISTSLKLNSQSVWSVMDDQYHNLWIGTHTGGLSKYNRETKLFTHYTHQDSDSTSISSNLVWTTYEDKQGNLWVGTAGGLNLLNRVTGRFTAFVQDANNPSAISNSSVFCIIEDSKNRLWVGTATGLNLMDRETHTFSVFNKQNGFLNESIKSIVEDANGLLWVNTDNGFSSFDPESKKIKNYNRLNGQLVGDSKSHVSLASHKGELIFIGTKGLRIVNPGELSENKTVPPVVLTDLKLFSDSVAIGGKDGILPTAINHNKTITLDYTQSNITLNFAALNFRNSEKNKYTYKLEGFEKNWLPTGTQHAAKYTNLNPGTYIFKVKASNNDDLWNEEGKTITIVQLPPPWKTWWAYTLYVLTIVSAILVFTHSQRKKRLAIEEQNRFLEITVLERTAELREKNNDIQTMLSNMRQGLFTIVTGGSIHPEYSHFLENIFETHEISGRSAIILLFEKANLGSDKIDRIKTSINAIVGEDKINFDFNSHLLIQEYNTTINGKEKSLSLDWNSVVVNNIVVKLMVSVRDVTLLKKMEIDARRKKRELDIISQLLNVPSKKYLGFAASVKRFIEENRAHIESNEKRNNAVIALLFRNMHTIKGNCRTFSFDHFSNVVHEVESVYSSLNTNPNADWDRDRLLSDLLRVQNILQEYENIFYTVLGRGESNGEARDQYGFWADRTAIDIIQHSVNKAHNEYPVLGKTQPLLPIQSLLNHALSNPLSDLLSDIVNSLPSIAIQLKKETPKVIINDNNVRITFTATELITNIFAHILRNNVDHGIETAAVRVQAGKPGTGTIEVHAVPQKEKLHIHIKDDGQGVNIDRLFKKGVEVGAWKADDKPGYSDVANLIFASGVSTKEVVTNISGRGVGMDAVKEFLLAQGGNISLKLLGANANGTQLGEGVMVPFELIVELPEYAFVVT